MINQIEILSPGFLTTIQDLGREGSERFGVPVSGAMDRFALMAANALADNPLGAAGLEFTLQGPALRLAADTLVAAAGCGFELAVDGRRLPLWMAAWVRAGEAVELISTGRGGWGYLALHGGIVAPEVLGSRATYLRGALGGLEGRALQSGDILGFGGNNAHSHYNPTKTHTPIPQKTSARQPLTPGQLYALAGLSLPESLRPAYSERPVIEVILGPQLVEGEGGTTKVVTTWEGAALPRSDDFSRPSFTPAGLAAFLEGSYTLTPACDRMGFRLAGPKIEHAAAAGELLSEGIPLGAVQVPGDGQPIVLMADRQATGGYPKIAVVTSASLPLLAQTPIGAGVRFQAVSLKTAQEKWRILTTNLHEFWTNLHN